MTARRRHQSQQQRRPTDAALGRRWAQGDSGASARGRLLQVALATLVVATVTLGARPALAWRRVQELVRGTADTLEKGRLTVGIFAPAMVGLNDTLTLSSHPILNLLLVPNLDLRQKIYADDAWVFSAYGGYKQGFRPVETSGIAGATHLGAIATRYLGDRLALTAGVGWAGRIDRIVTHTTSGGDAATATPVVVTDLALDHGVETIGSLSWLIDDRHALMVTGYARFDALGVERPAATAAFLFAPGAVQFVVGLSYGTFELRPITGDSGDGRAATTVPVFPYVDLWWDF